MVLKRINNEGLTSEPLKDFKYLLLQANDEQVLAILKEVLMRVPQHGLPKVLDLVDAEYERRGLSL
jgi:hypothetical protein